MSNKSHFIAIVGGSGSGKSWLSGRLQEYFGRRLTRVSLDDFYRDRSRLPASRREHLNFDHPNAIDWELFRKWLLAARAGRAAALPRYDFKTHSRQPSSSTWSQAPLVAVDGLWLLWKASLRRLFDFSVFIDCPAEVRLERRASRDLVERGRTVVSVRRQFAEVVAPMHEIYVDPQMRWADLVLSHPLGEGDLYRVAARLTDMLSSISSSHPLNAFYQTKQVGKGCCI
jgi:uridine kinase